MTCVRDDNGAVKTFRTNLAGMSPVRIGGTVTAVNIAHVRMLRLQADGRDWELKLKPPVNRVLPIARDRLNTLRRFFGEPKGQSTFPA